MKAAIAAQAGSVYVAELRLARHLWRVAERNAAEHDVYYVARTLADQCEQQARAVRDLGRRLNRKPLRWVGRRLEARLIEGVDRPGDRVRRVAARRVGRQGASGLSLLHDLRQLYQHAQDLNLNWIILHQLALAAGDRDLVTAVIALHEQTRTQIAWITTKVKEASPQILLVR